MFWIALELSIPKIGFNTTLAFTVKELDAFKFDGVTESDNTVNALLKKESRQFQHLTKEEENDLVPIHKTGILSNAAATIFVVRFTRFLGTRAL